jgi:hypothetical protein
MKTLIGFIFIINTIIIIIVTPGCKKDKLSDERDFVIGNYEGILIETTWVGNGYKHDTSNISITLNKSNSDSIIDLIFKPSFIDINYSFKYHNNIFISIDNYHPPKLTKSNDSLYFHVQPALGPDWYDCNVRKQK